MRQPDEFEGLGLKDARGKAMRADKFWHKGVTLLELLVAMILLVMVSAMLYSVLNAGIGFSRKGEEKLRQVGRGRALLELLHRQVHGAWFDKRLKKLRLETDGDYLRLVTTAPLLNRDSGLTLALYFYDPARDTLYYKESRDFYNPDYEEDYRPRREEMTVLMKDVGGIAWEFDDSEGLLHLEFGEKAYSMVARCWRPGN
jgi:prepilin-type N-terminal cleavage/methylation domain-containing protein